MIALPKAGASLKESVAIAHAWALAHFEYMRDDVRWAGDPTLFRGEHWETDTEIRADLERNGRVIGDCDAFGKLCRLLLWSMGVENRLVFCKAETGEGHLVCEAGGWVLDNRQDRPETRGNLESLGYAWVSMSAFKPGEPWTTIRT